jgi:frataxin-like iron-binding protein CyaY
MPAHLRLPAGHTRAVVNTCARTLRLSRHLPILVTASHHGLSLTASIPFPRFHPLASAPARSFSRPISRFPQFNTAQPSRQSHLTTALTCLTTLRLAPHSSPPPFPLLSLRTRVRTSIHRHAPLRVQRTGGHERGTTHSYTPSSSHPFPHSLHSFHSLPILPSLSLSLCQVNRDFDLRVDSDRLSLTLSPSIGSYELSIDRPNQRLILFSPSSGIFKYEWSTRHESWVNETDEHFLVELLVRELLKHCQGVPKL